MADGFGFDAVTLQTGIFVAAMRYAPPALRGCYPNTLIFGGATDGGMN
jgi:hypothetical protein